MKQSEEITEELSAQTAEAEKTEGAADNATGYGKFKDAESLLKAYESLESEFTRRSQRLKALESGRDDVSAAEKTDASVTEKKFGVDDFLRERPYAEQFSETLKERLKEKEGKEDISRAYADLLEEKLGELESKLEDGNFLFEKFKSDGKIRAEIVKDYLKSLLDAKPKTDFGGGMAVVAPPHRPKTLEEAGKLARDYIKIKGEL